MTAEFLAEAGIRPGLSLLPEKMRGPNAERQQRAKMIQETDLKLRRQMGGGPGIGFAQLEKNEAILNVFTHSYSAFLLPPVCDACAVPYNLDEVARACQDNDVLMSAMTRLEYFLSPLPVGTDEASGLLMYSHVWEPQWFVKGQPEPGRWAASWSIATKAAGITA